MGLKRRKTEISTCICPECDQRMYVPRLKSMTKEKGHHKKIWCPFCQKEMNMTEYRGSKDVYRNMLGETI